MALPLFIFEERYRVMLNEVLENQRLFFVVAENPSAEKDSPLANAMPNATVGMVSACIENADGTSNLLLNGIQRVRLKRISDTSLYPLADVEVIKTETGRLADVERLRERVLDLVSEKLVGNAQSEALTESLRQPDRLEACPDVLASRLLQDSADKHEFLGLGKLADRYAMIEAAINKLSGPEGGQSG